MDTDHYDSFTEDDRISKDDVSILSAYHAYLTSFDEEPSLYEFQTYYDDLVEQGLAPKLHSQIKSLPQKNISNYTGNETITSEDVTILDSYQSFLVGNENKKAKDISEFKSYHDAFMVLKNKKTRLDSEIVKLPKFKEKNNTKKVELKKRRTTNLLECGTLEFENLERKGFLYNNREYLGATFGNGNCGKGNKQTFLPLSDKQIKKAIEYRENDFLVYDHETNQYQFKYNKSVSLLDYPLIFKKGKGAKGYQVGLSFKKPIYVPRGSQIHLHFIKTSQLQKKITEEPSFSVDETMEIQNTASVAFSENFNSETSDFRQKDWKGNLCGPICWWYPLDESRSIGQTNTKFKQDTIIYNMFSDLIYGGCAINEKSAFELRLLAFTITPPSSETKKIRRKRTKEVKKSEESSVTDFLVPKTKQPEVYTEIVQQKEKSAGVNIQFQNDISLVGDEINLSDNKNLDKQDRDKAKYGINISFRNKNSLLSHIKIVDEVLKSKQKELFAQLANPSTPTPTHTNAKYIQPAEANSVAPTPTPTHTSAEYIQPSEANSVPTTPSPTHTSAEYIQPSEANSVAPTPTPTHTSAEYIQPKDKK